MKLSWDIFSTKADLIHLIEYLSYTQKIENPKYILYTSGKKAICIINLNGKYVFFFPSHPKQKGGVIDLLLFHVSKMSPENQLSECDKVNHLIENYVSHVGGIDKLYASNFTVKLEPAESEFDLFYDLYIHSGAENLKSIYSDSELSDTLYSGSILNNPLFIDKIIQKNDHTLFPLFNQNLNCVGMLANSNKGLVSLPYSETTISIWYSNIPKKTDYIFVFNSPNEAIAFYSNFKEENAIYISISTINFTITQLLLDIQKNSKAKNLVLNFTDNGKGYVNDLLLFSNMKQNSLKTEIKNNHLEMSFEFTNEKHFSSFYKLIKGYNQKFQEDYLKYNTHSNQNMIRANSISVLNNSKNPKELKIKLPISINPLKVFVWSYLKHFIKPNYSGTIDILKPAQQNWYTQLKFSKINELENQKINDYKLAI